MRYSVRPLSNVCPFGMLLLAIFLGGCTTPPSVTPLLRITENALLQEAENIREDARHGTEQMRRSLDVLEEGFNRDLEQIEVLTPRWVREATAVYVLARETVVKHQNAMTQAHNNRAENLRAAAAATRRAIALIERRDRLLDGVVGEDLRRLISQTGLSTQEVGR